MEPPSRTSAASPTNRLAQEKSPYLLQHADNPVDWMPWNEEAFAKARAENKPIFLSIGYSTCHWCHVMAHESFEDDATAEIMNREFVNIKVDREERPDVDRVYMTFVQATTGHGGWPMSVWLTPELKPFVGGTYFPPEDRHGQSWLQEGARAHRGRVEAGPREHRGAGDEDCRSPEPICCASRKEAASNSASKVWKQPIARSRAAMTRTKAGFGGAPKFPRPVLLNFLFRVYARDPESATGKNALAMNLFTLRKMAAGGMHDHLGGGFSRYSVDGFWHVPHFEKMLYDQAQLAVAYIDAFQITHDPEFEKVARDVLDYVRRDMTAPEGGFYSAEDADSEVPEAGSGDPGHRVKAEGAFYVWTKAEIDTVLGASAEIFEFHYGVEADGNAPPGADPHGEFVGKNILIERHTIAETAEQFGKSETEVREILAQARAVALGGAQQAPASASGRQDHHRLERLDDLRLRARGAGAR